MNNGNPLRHKHIDNILLLKVLSRPFPTTAGVILEIAKEWDFSSATISFIGLFSKDTKFENEHEFITRCEEVEEHIKQTPEQNISTETTSILASN